MPTNVTKKIGLVKLTQEAMTKHKRTAGFSKVFALFIPH